MSMMVSTNSPDGGSGRSYDVFLNFRGSDSRDTIANVIYHSLTEVGIRVFMDDDEIGEGEEIKGEPLEAITNSRIYIIIFSKDYASSKLCLSRLARIMDRPESSSAIARKAILPIFYNVNVSEEGRLALQVYTTALQKHIDEVGKAVVKPWEDALREVATIKGWKLKDHGLINLADLIKKEVLNKLNASDVVPRMSYRLIGILDRKKDIMHLLEEGSPSVRYIVIHGIGGIGKTTLANVIFNKIYPSFQGSCILNDVRRSLSVHGMVKLQQKLLSDTLDLKLVKVSDIDDGISIISKRLCDKKILIVLDNVDKRDLLRNLAAKSEWFGPGSRIIITTRNAEFLSSKDNKEYWFYEMKEIESGQAHRLFCLHAFKNELPPPEYYDTTTKIVATIGGNPLALQVIGSSLYNQPEGTWNFILQQLKGASHNDVEEKLMLSYQALEYDQQQIFLDIACFFNDEEKIDPIYFWEACNFNPSRVINVLVSRSLIKVNYNGTLWMHEQLRDLGKAIAQPKIQSEECQMLAKPTRLWSPKVALDVLLKKEVTKSITALKLGKLDAGCHFSREEFVELVNLKFLELQGGNLEGDFQNVFQELRWLTWEDCPLKIKATNLSFRSLTVLKLSGKITNDWGGWSSITEAKHLKVLHLRGCECLKKTPDFFSFLQLERLILKNCFGLEEINRSIGKLRHLDYLEISNDYTGYTQPRLLPDSIGSLKSLRVLKMNNVPLTELHPSIGELVNLTSLCLRCRRLEHLPSSIGKLISLEELDLTSSGVIELPRSIGDLRKLKILRMGGSNIEYIPESIGRLESLVELNMNDLKITELPETIRNLKRLKFIYLDYTQIKRLPMALAKLENLEELHASSCFKMDGELPEEIGKLFRLRILDLTFTKVSAVPRTIKLLSSLEELHLGECYESKELPELPTSLRSLKVSFPSLKSCGVPDLSNMTNLVTLKLFGGKRQRNDYLETSQTRDRTPNMVGLASLKKAVEISLFLPDLILPPTDLRSLSRLRELAITCLHPQSLIHLPSSLEILELSDVESPINWQLFSSSNNLHKLGLYRCRLREFKVGGPGELEIPHLQTLSLGDSPIVERISNLSCLRGLQNLVISNFPCLDDIQGLGEMELLRSINIDNCKSIRWLPNLSRLKELQELRFHYCKSLESIPEISQEAPCRLSLYSCKNFRDYFGPYSKYNDSIFKRVISSMHNLLRGCK